NAPKNELPLTESTAFVLKCTRFVVDGVHPPLGVNVMVSCSASHVNVPTTGGVLGDACAEQMTSDPLLVHRHVAGVTENAASTELVFIGLLNRRTTDAAMDTFVAACDGTWFVTTGSSGNTN